MPEPLLISFAQPQPLQIADDADRVVRGLAVPFGVDSRPHTGGLRHRFARGAFARTIAERSHKIRLHVEHDQRSLPIGRAVELREHDDGLHAAFELAATARGDEALTLVREGMVTGLSVSVVPVRYRDRGPVVEHTESSLREISLVNEPAFELATTYSADDGGITTVEARMRLAIIERTWTS